MARGIKLMDTEKAHTVLLETAERMDTFKRMDAMEKAGIPVYSVAYQKELKKASATNTETNKTLYGFFASETNYAGIKLFTYWLAIMTVLGGFTPNRAPFNSRIVRAFFRSNSVLTHHAKNGNLERVDSTAIRLTITGWNYFNGRLNGSIVGQSVDRKELADMVESITKGGKGYRAI